MTFVEWWNASATLGDVFLIVFFWSVTDGVVEGIIKRARK